MAAIDVTPSEVRGICGTVASTYSEVKTLIDQKMQEVQNIETFWVSSQADKFVAELNRVNDEYKEFYTKYEAIITYINNSMSTYDATLEAQNQTVNNYANTGGC